MRHYAIATGGVIYLRAYDAAEAWAWRGEVAEGDC